MKNLLASLVALFTAFSAAGQTDGYLEISSPEDPRPFYDLRINEAWIDGIVTLVNDNQNQPGGFIELKNSSTAEISLEGYQLRAVGTPFPAFTFPSIAAIDAGGYERVWTSGKDLPTANNYHMPFWIMGADSITLHDPSGNLIDVLDLSNTQPDVSIGRCDWDWCATNDRAVFYFDTPTPLAANAQANILNLVAPNHVSVKAGTTVSVPTVRPQGGKPIFSLEFGTGASIDSNGVIDVPTDILPDRTPVGMPASRESLADDNLTSSLAGSSVQTDLSTVGWVTGVSSANLIGHPMKTGNASIGRLYNTPLINSRDWVMLGEDPEPEDSCIYFSSGNTNIRCTTDNFLTSTDLGAGPLASLPAGKSYIFKTPLGWFFISVPTSSTVGASVYKAPLDDTSPWVSQDWVRQDIAGQSGVLAETTWSLLTHSFDWYYDSSTETMYVLLFDYSSLYADSAGSVGNSIYRAVYTAETGVGDFVSVKTWNTITDVDPSDGTRHGHVMQFDPFTGHAWAGMGDGGADNKLIVSYDFGLTWTIFAMGLQDYRPLAIWFTPNSVWWNADNGSDMDLFRLPRSKMVGGEWPVHAVEYNDSGTLRPGVVYVIDEIANTGAGTIAQMASCTPSCAVGAISLPGSSVTTLGAGDRVYVVLDPNTEPWTKYGIDSASHWFVLQMPDPLDAGGFMTIMAIEAGTKTGTQGMYRDGRLRLVGINENADASVIDIQELFSWPRRTSQQYDQLVPRHISPSGVMMFQGRNLANYSQGQTPNVYDPTRNIWLMDLDWKASGEDPPPSADAFGGNQSSPGVAFPGG